MISGHELGRLECAAELTTISRLIKPNEAKANTELNRTALDAIQGILNLQ